MKYTLSNTIHKSLDEVAEKFNDPDGMYHWMEGLQKVERVSGEPGEVGAISNLHYKFNKKEMVLRETILESNPPHQMKFLFESSMGSNEVEIVFEELSENEVKQTNHTTMHLKGIMKILGFLFVGMFKKQSMKYMVAFKEYVEK